MTGEIQKLNQPDTRGTWVQTERAAHKLWLQLIDKSPRAAKAMHFLVANMDEQAALVGSQKTLSKMSGMSLSTMKRALVELEELQWIQTVSIGGEKGGVKAYIVNSRIAWADSRENLKWARFNARVLISDEDQLTLEGPQLKSDFPTIDEGDMQIPNGLPGPDPEPPEQKTLPTMELPELPGLVRSKGKTEE